MNLLYLFIQVISTILLLVAKGKMRRREIDLKEEEDSRSESKLWLIMELILKIL